MNGRRQLPSWMLKSNAADEARSSDIKVNKDDSGAADNTASKYPKKVQTEQCDTGLTLLENKSHLLKKCEARSKRKLIKHGEQEVSVDESEQEKNANTKVVKTSQQGDGEHLLNKCEKNRSKRKSNKQPCDQSDDFCEGGMEDKGDIVARKRRRSNTSRRKKEKEANVMVGFDVDSIASDDEITVEDLIIMAKEYIKAEKEKKLQKVQNVRFESEVKHLHTTTSKIGSEMNLTKDVENRISFTDKPVSIDSSVTKPSLGGGSITNPSRSGDPAQDMLELFLGPLLKTSGKVEREDNIMTENLILDHEVSQSRHNDTVLEVPPVTKKKSSLKDRAAMLLD